MSIPKNFRPCNPNAARGAKNLLNYLGALMSSDKTVFGSFDTDSKNDTNYNGIKSRYGVSPGMYSTYYPFDFSQKKFMYAIPNRSIIEHYNEGAIILAHNQNEWGNDIMESLGAGEEEAGVFVRNFDAENPDRDMTAYNLYISCRRQWADALEELKNAGVSLIFRPFVEMNNKGAFPATYANTPEALESFKNMWRQLYHYMTDERGLNNILFCYSPYVFTPDSLDFYPGGEYVDIMSTTMYPEGTEGLQISDRWDYREFLEKGKPFAFSELGVVEEPETKTRPDWLQTLNAIDKHTPHVAFINIWNDYWSILNEIAVNTEQFVNSPRMLKLSDIPDLK